jgi:hypothetical protein
VQLTNGKRSQHTREQQPINETQASWHLYNILSDGVS